MKFMKKLLSTMTAAAIGLSMTTALSVGTSVASAADKTAVQMVEDMGLGWNLGNALDSTNTWTSNPSPADVETAGQRGCDRKHDQGSQEGWLQHRPDPCHLVGYDRCFRHRKDGFV